MPDIADAQGRATGVRVSKGLLCGEDQILLIHHCQASQARIWTDLRPVRSTGDGAWAVSARNSGSSFAEVEWRDGRLVDGRQRVKRSLPKKVV